MQLVPRCRPLMIRKRFLWLLPLGNDGSIMPLDPCTLWRVDPAVISVAVAQAPENTVGFSCVDRHRRLVVGRVALHAQQVAREVVSHIYGADGIPAVEITVSAYDSGEDLGSVIWSNTWIVT